MSTGESPRIGQPRGVLLRNGPVRVIGCDFLEGIGVEVQSAAFALEMSGQVSKTIIVFEVFEVFESEVETAHALGSKGTG